MPCSSFPRSLHCLLRKSSDSVWTLSWVSAISARDRRSLWRRVGITCLFWSVSAYRRRFDSVLHHQSILWLWAHCKVSTRRYSSVWAPDGSTCHGSELMIEYSLKRWLRWSGAASQRESTTSAETSHRSESLSLYRTGRCKGSFKEWTNLWNRRALTASRSLAACLSKCSW